MAEQTSTPRPTRDPFEAAGFSVSGGSSGRPEGIDPFQAAGFTSDTEVRGREAASAVGEGFGFGLIRGAGALGGAALGAKAGVVAGAPGGPIGSAVGGVVGGVAGAVLGSEGPGRMATEGLGLRSPEEMERRLRPYAYFGESLGGSATIVGSVYSMAASGMRFVGQGAGSFINSILDTARRNPGTFAAIEGASALGAAGAAGTAEAVAGDTKYGTEIRMTAEILGGMLLPNLTTAALTRGYQEVRRLSEGLTPGGAERGAVRMIRETFERTGGDISAVAEAYRTAGLVPTGTTTPAQKTGSIELTAIEDYVASMNKDFGRQVDQRFRDSLDVLRTHVAMLSTTGDPRDLEVAAKMQQDFFVAMVQARATEGALQARRAASNILPSQQTTMARESQRMNDAIQEGIAISRQHEAMLWNEWLRVDGQQPTTATNLEAAFRHHQDALDTWSAKLPSEVAQFLRNLEGSGTQRMVLNEQTGILQMQDVRGSAQPTTAEKMWNQRSQILAEMRMAQSGANPDRQKARILGDLAEAITRDLESAMTPEGRIAFDNARAYTREFYDVYQRSFVGRTQATGAYGDMMPPEVIASRAFAGRDDAVNIRLDELEEATRFIQRHGLGGETAVANMLDAQEQIARLTASSVIDPNTNRVSPERINALLRPVTNDTLFNRFPELKADLIAAKTSEEAARRLERLASTQPKMMENRVLGRVLRKDPVPFAMEVLNSPNMNRDLQGMIDAVRPIKSRGSGWRVSPDDVQLARRGIAASVFEGALRISADRNGVINPNAFRALIDVSPVPGQKTALQILQDNGIIDANHARNIRRMFSELDALQSTTRNQRAIEVSVDLPEATGAVLARMLGSGAAGNLARAAGSNAPSLVVHGAGAKFFEHVYTKLGITTASRFLSEAMLDPAMMDVLLTKASTQTPIQRAATNRRIYAWLVQSGLGIAEETGQDINREVLQPYMQQPDAPTLFTQPR